MARKPHYENFSGSAAENYERYFVPLIPAPLVQDLLATAALEPGERVLDVACGTGIVARRAAASVGPTGAVTGVDLAADMIELARSLSAADRLSIDWQEGNAEALPVEDASFDVVTSQLGLMFADDKAAAVREMRRALVPGGRVVINVPGSIQPLMEGMGESLARHVNPDLAGFVHAVFSLHDPGELEALLDGAGFTDISAWTVDKSFRLPPPADFLAQYLNATPMGAFVSQAPKEARAAMVQDVVERWQPFVQGDGMIYDQPIVWGTARA